MRTQKGIRSRIQKWGNSLGVRIPGHIAQRLHLHPGSIVSVEVEDGKIIVQTGYNLNDMVNAITEENQHHLQLDDDQVGAEEW